VAGMSPEHRTREKRRVTSQTGPAGN